MEKTLKKTSVVVLLALICCALWGSAFPCIKIGYELLQIETVGSQILFAGYRFFLAGVFTWLLACIFEKTSGDYKEIIRAIRIWAGIVADNISVYLILHRNGKHDRRKRIGNQCVQQLYFHRGSLHFYKIGENDLAKSVGLQHRISGSYHY